MCARYECFNLFAYLDWMKSCSPVALFVLCTLDFTGFFFKKKFLLLLWCCLISCESVVPQLFSGLHTQREDY